MPPDDDPEGPRPIGEALDAVLAGLGVPPAAAVRTVFSSWETLVGAELAAHARPVSLDHGCLLIAVDSPGWASRLRYDEAAVLTRGADILGPGVLRRIQVRVRAG